MIFVYCPSRNRKGYDTQQRMKVVHENAQYFLKNAIIPKSDLDYYLVINGPSDFPDEIPNVNVVKRDNIGREFEGWGCIARLRKWDRYIFINDTARGPFLPRWSDSHWTDSFLSPLNKLKNGKPIKLVGPTENHGNYHNVTIPHIQSYCFGTDSEGLDAILDAGIFDMPADYSAEKIVVNYEMGLSKCIVDKGWEFYSFLLSQNKYPTNIDVAYRPGRYNGITVNPIELMFIKTTNIYDLYVHIYTHYNT